MQDPTLSDVLEAVNNGFSEMEGRIGSRMDNLERKFDNLEHKVDNLTIAVDGFAGNQRKFEDELAANRAVHERFDERITNIENRA